MKRNRCPGHYLKKSSGNVFEAAVNLAVPLKFCKGLSAITRGQGKGQIVTNDNHCIRGSVNIDEDCKKTDPHGNRWDYAIGYARNNDPVVYYVEVHSASSHNVDEMEKKLDWLEEFLRKPTCASLNKLPKEYRWVASGRNTILRQSAQYKRLVLLRSKRRLFGPDPHLVLK